MYEVAKEIRKIVTLDKTINPCDHRTVTSVLLDQKFSIYISALFFFYKDISHLNDLIFIFKISISCSKETVSISIQAFLDFRGFVFHNFQFTAVYNSILFSSPLVLLSNLDLHGFCFSGFISVSQH